ncbi:hypothetical protein PWG15_32970 (plasmid) [Ensifer adhaerens]|uniref:hypothetical protein n=1 Tax=Ensifer adhaerens TaxID=106592 RepID=UPI0023A91574|nr:hypothetical protein [Ensifer adhaerens]WDZ81739.1 hypothetical protein PWG15_32970 [Ensifer adhaerens]
MKKTEQRYFHVIVWTAESGGDPRFLLGDLSETQLKKQFVNPYRTGGKIIAQQAILSATDLKGVKIFETPVVKDEALKAVQDRSLVRIEEFRRQRDWTSMASAGYGWDDVDITHVGKDVTTHYIDGKPGSPSLLDQITQSSLLPVAGAGIIVLALLVWLMA